METQTINCQEGLETLFFYGRHVWHSLALNGLLNLEQEHRKMHDGEFEPSCIMCQQIIGVIFSGSRDEN